MAKVYKAVEVDDAVVAGKPVVIRTARSGVHFGYLIERRGQEADLVRIRQVWSWVGANTVKEIAIRGVGKGSKVSEAAPESTLFEIIECLSATEEAVKSIEAGKWG